MLGQGCTKQITIGGKVKAKGSVCVAGEADVNAKCIGTLTVRINVIFPTSSPSMVPVKGSSSVVFVYPTGTKGDIRADAQGTVMIEGSQIVGVGAFGNDLCMGPILGGQYTLIGSSSKQIDLSGKTCAQGGTAVAPEVINQRVAAESQLKTNLTNTIFTVVTGCKNPPTSVPPPTPGPGFIQSCVNYYNSKKGTWGGIQGSECAPFGSY